jgi:rare lipoprotein A
MPNARDSVLASESVARYDRAMEVRTIVGTMALCSAALGLSSCANKHAATRAIPAPPRVLPAETGLASWYGYPYHGRAAADGEIYDMETLTAAHRTLPFGTRVRVTNVSNQKTVEVRIIDRGPFVDGRIIDLSHAAAEAIDLIGPGVSQVRLDILAMPETPVAGNWYGVQAGAFLDKSRAERLRDSLEREYGSARVVLRPGSPPLWRVVVGNEPTEEAANALARSLRPQLGTAFVVRVDPRSMSSQARQDITAEPQPLQAFPSQTISHFRP